VIGMAGGKIVQCGRRIHAFQHNCGASALIDLSVPHKSYSNTHTIIGPECFTV